MGRTTRGAASALITAALLLTTAGAVSAQDEPVQATVAGVNAGAATGTLELVGAVLGPREGDEFLFSDGTDVMTIAVDGSTAAELPSLTLLTIVGTPAADAFDVSSWEPLDIMMPAVIRLPEEAIGAFQGWIITQNSQAPVGTMDEESRDGEVLTDE